MIEPSIPGASPHREAYIDRSGGLVAFGILQAPIALACSGFVVLGPNGAGKTMRGAGALWSR